MDVDTTSRLVGPEVDDRGRERQLQDHQLGMVDDDEEVSVPPPPASATPGQPLSSAPAMTAALSEIAAGDPTSTTVRRGGVRMTTHHDPATRLRQQIADADEARRSVALANKAEAERAAASGRASTIRPDKRTRSASIDQPLVLGKKARVNIPAADPNAMDATPAKNRPTSFDHLFKHRIRCAVQIDDCPIMGNPFSSTPGWDLKVDLDPGRRAQPSVGLDFRFSKDGSDSNSKDDYNTFGLGWKPGVKIGGEWMMDHFLYRQANSGPNLLHVTWPSALQELCKKPQDADRVCCIMFRSLAHKSTQMSLDWAKQPRGGDWEAPYANLERMYAPEQQPSYIVRVWFLNPVATLDRLSEGCLAPLEAAVNHQTPLSHQYLGEADRSDTDFECSEPDDSSTSQEGIGPHIEEGSEKAFEATEGESVRMSEDVDALRAENLQLKSEKSSLQHLLQDRNERIRKLADDLGQARKERDAIVQAAEGIKHHRDLKPNELQKALNAVAKILR